MEQATRRDAFKLGVVPNGASTLQDLLAVLPTITDDNLIETWVRTTGQWFAGGGLDTRVPFVDLPCAEQGPVLLHAYCMVSTVFHFWHTGQQHKVTASVSCSAQLLTFFFFFFSPCVYVLQEFLCVSVFLWSVRITQVVFCIAVATA